MSRPGFECLHAERLVKQLCLLVARLLLEEGAEIENMSNVPSRRISVAYVYPDGLWKLEIWCTLPFKKHADINDMLHLD